MDELNRTIIENLIRKTLRDIKDSPDRSLRNLVDLGVQLTKGRFQTLIFQSAQKMLKNPLSNYYALFYDMVLNTDEDRLVNFSLNLGFNSFTLGAKKIRETESKENFDIPWSVFLDIDSDTLKSRADIYNGIIGQGLRTGIYTWLIRLDKKIYNIFPIIKNNPDCAFILFCPSKEITPSVMDDAAEIKNIMFAPFYDEETEKACSLLRESRMLYALAYSYDSSNILSVIKDELVAYIETMHPSFTIMMPSESCSVSCQKEMAAFVNENRNKQKYKTVLWEIYSDNRFIDGIISDNDCFCSFGKSGNLILQSPHKEVYNIFETSLKNIFSSVFPKKIF